MSRPSAGRKPRGQICNPLRDRSAQNRGKAPSPSVASLPATSPRAAGRGEKRNLVLAAQFCVRVMPTTTTPFQKIRPRQQKGGEAPKGAIQPLAAQHQQALPPIDARARLRAITEARPPSGASPRHSPGRTHPALAQPQNRVSRHLELAGVLPAYILASVKRAPRRPVFLPVDRCPRAARDQLEK